MKDIRWKQRFQNFEKVFESFKEAMNEKHDLSDLEIDGTINVLNLPLSLSGRFYRII